MKTPGFWRARGVVSTLLLPLSWAYARAASGCAKKTPTSVDVPVICVGNVTAGGTGKTPVALDLLARLKTLGHAPHALTRGYGGRERGPLQVIPSRHTAGDVGDEALLLARAAPTWVARRRAEGARAAVDAGADVIIMDDGLQNPALHKNLSLVVIDGGFGFGNERLIPAGPLREPLETGLARADAAVIVGEDKARARDAIKRLRPDLTVLTAHARPDGDYAHLRGARVIAFAGIGRPKKFFETLQNLGVNIVSAHPFADHHPFTAADIKKLRAEAHTLNARLVTTDKDLVRLPDREQQDVETVGIRITWDDEAAVKDLIARVMDKSGAAS